ncbi:MAG: Tn3 family transposase [Gammaproteobacteria bacterium]
MPSTFLTSKERERLVCFPDDIQQWDLITYFTLTEHDCSLIDSYQGESNRLGAALQLCAVRYLGFCPANLNTTSSDVTAFLARQLKVDPSVLQDYGKRRMTRSVHFNAVLNHLGFRRVQIEDHEQIVEWLTERALEHDKPTLLFQMICERLKQQQMIRPAVTTLERWVVTARIQAHHESFRRLQPLLTPERVTLLDSLLITEGDQGKTQLYQFRQPAISNTPMALLSTLGKFATLQSWSVDEWEMSALNPNRQKFLARLGRKYTVQALRRMGPERRYPILLSFLQQTLIDLTDESIDIFDVCIASRHKKARKALQDYQTEIAETTEAHSQLLQTIGDLVLDDTVTDDNLRQAIYYHIPRSNLQLAVKEAHSLRRPNSYFDFLDDHYSYVRQFAPQFLDTLSFDSHEADDTLLEAIEVFRSLNTTKQRKLPEDVPVDFVPDNWQRFVAPEGQPERRAYELCTLSTLRDRLRSGDIYLPNSRRYTDPETFLIPRSEWPNLRTDVCGQLDLDPTGKARLSERAQELKDLLPRVDRVLDRSDGIRIEDGELIVPMDDGEDLPESVQALDDQIRRRIPDVDLTDLLLEVDQWTGFSQYLTHAGGGQPRTDDLLLHQHAAIVGQGTNMGLLEMAHSAGLAYDRLAWASTWYLREETLKAAVTALVNFQYRQPLAQHWGGGTLSSSDGQRFPVQGKVRNARALPKYFGYGEGITFYTWSSDQFSQYGTKVISSTVRDATYVLDEILNNETDLTLLEHTTDTAGYTDLVFCLFDLLGMQFSPRLRDIGDRQLYKLTTDAAIYPRLDTRLMGRIDLPRLLEKWDDLARIAGSLKRGYVTASLLISRLQAYPRQGQLTKLLQEYGRLVKTIFVLRYLEDAALRRRVHAQLNKGEKLHDLRKFLFFAREGVVSQKYEEGQANQAGCLNLLTNAVIVWNTVYMQAALDSIRREGYPVQEEDLAHLWPIRFAHIHRYGKYEFNVEAARARAGLRPLKQR